MQCSGESGEALGGNQRHRARSSNTSRPLANDVNRGPIRNDRELLGETDEMNRRTVGLMPIGSTIRTPTLLAGGLVGNCDGCGKQIFGTHGHRIAIKSQNEQCARRTSAP